MSIDNNNSLFHISKEETLHKIFFDKIENELKSNDEEFTFNYNNPRLLSNQENNFVNDIEDNKEKLNSIKNFLIYEMDLERRFLKILKNYYPFIKEPYKRKINKVKRYMGISSIVSGLYLLNMYRRNNNSVKSILLINLAIIGNLTIGYMYYYNLLSDYYKELFNYMPQKEVERRIVFLELNKI